MMPIWAPARGVEEWLFVLDFARWRATRGVVGKVAAGCMICVSGDVWVHMSGRGLG